MLNINLENFMIELDEGSIKNVGPTNKAAEAKLFDVDHAEVQEFGDRRVKVVARDGEGNEVQVALDPEQVRSLADDVARLEEDSPVFE